MRTPQEVRHDLVGAAVFTEMDMRMGFHQLPLTEKTSSRSVFQTHEGLHRMKRLYFGPTSSSGIFHHEVEKVFRGIPGCTTIHDNLLVYGRNHEEHRENLERTLSRCEEKGITLKLDKSNFCKNQVTWFGRVFSGQGVSSDPRKIETISTVGRPESCEDVRSFIQAAQFNVRFYFDNKEGMTYEEATAPLRELLKKGAKFEWNERRDRSYRAILNMMNAETSLRPYRQDLKTHFVSDASPYGIQASLYNEQEDKTWVPVDHQSRALTTEEKAWGSQIDWESLAKSWGMEQFRYYLSGCKFTSWGDQQPLVSLYNNPSRKASARLDKHRHKVQDLCFTDRYIPGKENPCDYGSRHPRDITGLDYRELEKLGAGPGEERFIRRIFPSDLPDAVSLDHIKEAAHREPTYQKLLAAVKSGQGKDNPDLVPYTSVWEELGAVDNLVCRGDMVVIPNSSVSGSSTNIRTWLVDCVHEGHQGQDNMKRNLRARVWFPGMDRQVTRRVEGCRACQAATPSTHRDPLKPTEAPQTPWQKVAVDHWGPTPDGKYLLVLVDLLTRYPEVEVVKGTGVKDNIHAFDQVFSRHGFPRVLFSDNGAPFNGNRHHELQEYFRFAGISHKPNRSPLDPEANGLAESFMKHCKKIWLISVVEKKDPVLETGDQQTFKNGSLNPTHFHGTDTCRSTVWQEKQGKDSGHKEGPGSQLTRRGGSQSC